MWFGRSEHLAKWTDHVQPAEVRHFMEAYEVQTKGITRKWEEKDKAFVNGEGKKVKGAPEVLEGWKPMGHWIVMNTHAIFVPRLGYQTMHDKAFEVQEKDSDGKWKHIKYTDYYGCELKEQDFDRAAQGWKVTSWRQDKFRNNGDEEGWTYSFNGIFFGDGKATDRTSQDHHKFRSRCIKRLKKLEAYNKELEDFEHFRGTLGDENWEYTTKKGGTYHDIEDKPDKIKRRRYIKEVESEDPFLESPSLRLYEYQVETGKWQRSILIAGGTRDIMKYPPVISVEVVGECANNEEANLGRFETTPSVVCSENDSRGAPHWFPLRFPKGRTRGAVLACFELFEEKNQNMLPLEPGLKYNLVAAPSSN